MTPGERKISANQSIVWTGDLSDDCTAEWAGLMLRAEWMDEDYWWWAVYDMQNGEATIDDSNNYTERFTGGDSARQKAESVAKKYISSLELPEPWYWTYHDLSNQLQIELSDDHQLKSKKVKTIARRQDCDDVLFELEDGKFALVHLTWRQTAHTDNQWPSTKIFNSWNEVYVNRILPDAKDFQE